MVNFGRYFSNKFFLAGLFIVALVALPSTIIVMQKQQQSQSSAVAATTLYFTPDSSEAAPIVKANAETFSLDLMLDPGTNEVSLLTLGIAYDPARLSFNQASGLQLNSTAFPEVMEGPVYNSGQIAVQISIGRDTIRAIKETVKVATLQFTAISGGGRGTTSIQFTSQTSALSIGANDTAAENVIAVMQPAVIRISGDPEPTGGEPSVSPTVSPAVSPTVTQAISPTTALTPTSGVTPSVTPVTSITPSVNPTGGYSLTPTSYSGYWGPAVLNGLKTSLTRIVENRIKQCENLVSKTDQRQGLSDTQKETLKTELNKTCQLWKNLLEEVKQAQTEEALRQAVADMVRLMVDQYSALALKVGAFNQGLQGLIQNASSSGQFGSSAQSSLNRINLQLGDLGMLSGKLKEKANGLGQGASNEKIKETIGSLTGDLSKLKTGFGDVKGNMGSLKDGIELNNTEMEMFITPQP